MLTFLNNSPDIWYLIGALLMVLEMITGGTIVLLFTVLAAISVAVLLQFTLINLPTPITQIIAFAVLFSAWSLVLWYPAKKLSRLRKENGKFSNIIGDNAVVHNQKLAIGKIGEIKWSGAACKAKLDPSAEEDVVKDQTVKIVSIDNNVFIVEKL